MIAAFALAVFVQVSSSIRLEKLQGQSVKSVFDLTAVAATSCNSGYSQILTEAECQAAAACLGYTYLGTDSSPTQVHGCNFLPAPGYGTQYTTIGVWYETMDMYMMGTTGQFQMICLQDGGTASCSAASSGDPHMVNIKNERFDVRKPGQHVLLQIPRLAAQADSLLRVDAMIRNHKNCKIQYIKRLNITGQWAEANRTGGIIFDPDVPNPWKATAELPHAVKTVVHGNVTLKLGPVGLQVQYVYTKKGFGYLNFHADSLGELHMPVGGLLGLDDHEEATKEDCTPAEGILQLNALGPMELANASEWDESYGDTAIGSFATATS